jgi:hypothetical protein
MISVMLSLYHFPLPITPLSEFFKISSVVKTDDILWMPLGPQEMVAVGCMKYD